MRGDAILLRRPIGQVRVGLQPGDQLDIVELIELLADSVRLGFRGSLLVAVPPREFGKRFHSLGWHVEHDCTAKDNEGAGRHFDSPGP